MPLSHDTTKIYARPDGIQVGFLRSMGTSAAGFNASLKCDPEPWSQIEAHTAPGASYVLDPPAIDTSMWDGYVLNFWSSAVGWPAVSVSCSLVTATDFELSVESSCTYRGEFLQAIWTQGVAESGPGTSISRSYADVVEPFPSVLVNVIPDCLWWISTSYYSVVATNLIDSATPFVPAPELPVEPVYPTPIAWNIGPC